MVQINALVLQRDERALLYGLGKAGAVHLSRTEAGPHTAPLAPPDKSPDLARCDDLLRRFENLHHAHGVVESPPSDEIVTMSLDQVDERLRNMEQQLQEVSHRRAQLEQQWSQVSVLLDQISSYQVLDVPLDQLERSTFLHFAIGSLPAKNLEDLRNHAAENVVLLPLGQQGDRQPVVAVTSRKGRFAMDTALKQASFRHEKLPLEKGSDIGGLAEESRAEQTRLTVELDSLREQQQRLTGELAFELARLEQTVREEHAILEAQQHFPHTDSAVLITGWTPAEQAGELQEQLRRVASDRCVIRIKQPDDVPLDQIPILLRQPRWLRPFASVVTGYGLPGYRDVEPTLFVAITYMLMFGIMFGDVGHGGVLAVGGLAAMWWHPPAKAARLRPAGAAGRIIEHGLRRSLWQLFRHSGIAPLGPVA